MHAPMISVVICTYNRAELLDIVLQTLCEQAIESSYYEVLVVDNNSTDNTRAVTENFCSRHTNFRYCFEPKQGLSYARNRGWQEALGEYIAYVDDECKVPKQWLSVAKEIIDQFTPGAFGGPIIGYFNKPKPRWFKYGSGDSLNEARFLHTEEYTIISGGNSFFKRNLLVKFGGFDPLFGMSGNKIGYGEETVLLKKINSNSQEKLYFDPQLYLYHLVLKKKWTWNFIIRASFSAGRSSFERNSDKLFAQKVHKHLLKHILKTFFELIIGLLRGVFHRDRNKFPYFQNYLFENSMKSVRKLGTLYAIYLNNSSQEL